MAEFSIKAGGSGHVANVDANSRLKVTSVTEEELNHACDSGIAEKYNINTGDVTVTNATKLTMLFIKNTGVYDLVITSLIYNLGNTTSGTGDVKFDVIRNPTAGGIVTSASNVAVGPAASANQNFGSQNTMTGLFYKGAVGEAVVSDGALTLSTRSAANTGRIVIALGSVVIAKGGSIAVDYTPPTSNTSQICQFAAAMYVRTPLVAS